MGLHSCSGSFLFYCTYCVLLSPLRSSQLVVWLVSLDGPRCSERTTLCPGCILMGPKVSLLTSVAEARHSPSGLSSEIRFDSGAAAGYRHPADGSGCVTPLWSASVSCQATLPSLSHSSYVSLSFWRKYGDFFTLDSYQEQQGREFPEVIIRSQHNPIQTVCSSISARVACSHCPCISCTALSCTRHITNDLSPTSATIANPTETWRGRHPASQSASQPASQPPINPSIRNPVDGAQQDICLSVFLSPSGGPARIASVWGITQM